MVYLESDSELEFDVDTISHIPVNSFLRFCVFLIVKFPRNASRGLLDLDLVRVLGLTRFRFSRRSADDDDVGPVGSKYTTSSWGQREEGKEGATG